LYAERILQCSFDNERRIYIKNLETIDLQAVPGSGKTTALLAKLLILDKYLPFNDGSGLLVISHTNAAVDEIKERIGRHCKNLFKYPNFVGTIQSFVDKFLCIPYYSNKNLVKPNQINNEIFDEYINDFLSNSRNLGLINWLKRKRDPIGFLRRLNDSQYLCLL
jgi:superfamily I DNA/RNA helicase